MTVDGLAPISGLAAGSVGRGLRSLSELLSPTSETEFLSHRTGAWRDSDAAVRFVDPVAVDIVRRDVCRGAPIVPQVDRKTIGQVPVCTAK